MHVGHFRLGTLANIWPLDSFKTEPKVCAVGNVAHTPAKHAKSCQVRCMKVKVTTYTSYRVIVSFPEGQETNSSKSCFDSTNLWSSPPGVVLGDSREIPSTSHERAMDNLPLPSGLKPVARSSKGILHIYLKSNYLHNIKQIASELGFVQVSNICSKSIIP